MVLDSYVLEKNPGPKSPRVLIPHHELKRNPVPRVRSDIQGVMMCLTRTYDCHKNLN
jgi:hypothetical protein